MQCTEIQLRIAETVFESGECKMITDANLVILRVNRALTEVTGFTAEEAIGQTPRLFQSRQNGPDFFQSMREVLLNTGHWAGEILNCRKDGEIYPCWLRITAVRDSDSVITHFVGTMQDGSVHKFAEDLIQNLAFFDPLTGLPNRSLLEDRLLQAMKANERNHVAGAVLSIVLENCQNLNDDLGYRAGNQLFVEVARRLVACVRKHDTVARLGSDEFMVLLEGLKGDDQEVGKEAAAIAKKIITNLLRSYQIGESEHHVSASVGCAVFQGQQVSIEEIMEQAGIAVRRAKEQGCNGFQLFSPRMQTFVSERRALNADLGRGIRQGQLVLYYQPLVDGLGMVVGAEALVRWMHPERGMVSPAEFIPLAEETGLILPLGQYVLEAACKQLVLWSGFKETAELTLAVNVSVRQFEQHDFVESVVGALQRTGAPPHLLRLEITESMLASNIEDIIERMSALKALGIGFSLDDFGTGYSSLSYLSRLPLDLLKIDRSFVSNIELNDNAVVICAATIALAQSLNLKVTAEGVETETQLYFLSTVHRCDYIQGYLISRPLPIHEFESFVRG
ncbi:MAG: hypothetical protein RLZZ371_1755 [Pseudomonadota bacterium]